jgi:GAF domain-containing protein/transcriptional regulator with XRE-family HTH domain
MTSAAPTEPSQTATPTKSRSQFATALQAILDDVDGFDRHQWATFLDVSESAISQWLHDRTLPSPERLRKIRDLLRTEPAAAALAQRFADICSSPTALVTPLSNRLGGATTFDEYMLNPLRLDLQRALAGFPPSMQEHALLIANEAARAALRSGGRVLNDTSPSAKFHALVAEARQRIGASSICFYVPDPLFDGDYRLAVQDGVRYPEAQQGPRFPMRASALAKFEQDHAFFRDAQSAMALREELPSDLPREEIHSLLQSNRLFGDFVAREEVVSCARIQQADGEHATCILFVNYAARQEFPDSVRDEIIALFESLREEALPHFTRLYSGEPWGDEREALHRLLITLQRFLSEHKRAGLAALERGLQAVIKGVLSVLGLDQSDTLGTIHLFEKDSGSLRPAAMVAPPSATIAPLPVLRVTAGHGLISWAAIRRQPIVVNDTAASEFRDTIIRIWPETRSELSIPMFAGADLVGVLNIESSRTNAFKEHIIRTVVMAASQMAILWQTFMYGKYIWTLERLIEVVDGDLNRTLKGIARVVVDYVECTSCDVWKYDPATQRFNSDVAGYSSNNEDVRYVSATGPRSEGWSRYVVDSKRPVFLYQINSCLDFRAVEWDGGAWVSCAGASSRALNPVSVSRNIGAQLGFPVMREGECLGIMWLRFKEASSSNRYLHPPASLVRALEVFGKQASRFLRFEAA